jgi:hypothetical protein
VPFYYFEAATADGKIQKKVLRAIDRKDADRRLRESGLCPILIESARAVKKKKREKALHTRRTVGNALLFVAGISLVGGIAGYLVMLDLRAAQSTIPAGIISYASNVNYGKTPDQRKFANKVDGLLKSSFPGSFRAVTVRNKSLMLIYADEKRATFNEGSLESIASMVTRGFQRKFDTKTCTVCIVKGEKEIAKGRYWNGKVTTSLY